MEGRVIGFTSHIVDVEFEKEFLPKVGMVLGIKMTDNILVVERFLSNTTVRALILLKKSPIASGDVVINTKKPIQVPIGDSIFGRVLNVLGQPMSEELLPAETPYIPISYFGQKKESFDAKFEIIDSGIKAINFFLPIVKGMKLGIFGGAGTGKTLFIKELMFNINSQTQNTKNMFVGIGERTREGEELYSELKESNLLSNTSIFLSQMNETPGSRMTILHAALTAAEYLRDEQNSNVLLFIDNIYRFIQAGSEISVSLGRKPSSVGYQPTLMSEVATVQNRMIANENGSITSFQTVFVAADDVTDPAAVAIFSHLESSFILDRKIAAEGIYPAIDLLESTSNSVNPKIIGQHHYDILLKTRKILQRYKELEDLITILGIEELSDGDKIITEKALQIRNFFTQNFFAAEPFTQQKGEFITIEQTVKSVENIVEGKFLGISPAEFLFIGSAADLEVEEQKTSTGEIKKVLTSEMKKVTEAEAEAPSENETSS